MSYASPSFSLADYLVFTGSLVISLGIGVYHWYRSRGRDTKDFLMGGGNMSPFPVSLSFAAGVISAVSILGNSAEMYYYGSQLSVNVIGVIIGTIVIMAVVMPIIFPLRLFTIFGYLEYRFGSSLVRKVASVLQLLNLSTYMGIALYAPSLAISSVTPITTNTSILVLGIVCAVYASMGGAKAVVYTDNFQSAVMLAGVIIVIVQGCAEVGGGASSWAIDGEHGRLEFFNLSTNPLDRHTLMTVIIFGVFFSFSTTGFSQAQYMRWGSVASMGQAYFVMVVGVVGVVGLWSLINYSGLVVFSVYADCDPLSAGYIDKLDQILMYFVADKLGYLPGIPGLFVAAIYSGVMSSVSSTINALSAMVWKDLLEPLSMFAKVSEQRAKTINIIISAVGGVVAIAVGVLAGSMGGLVQVTYALGGAISGPITGIFLTALLCPWVKELSVSLAALIALAFNMWVVMGSFLYAPPPTKLPLSTAGCYDPSANTTTDFTTSTSIIDTTSIITTTEGGDNGGSDDDVFPLYKLSYCLFGAIGILITMVLSSIFSIFFGFESPANLPASSVNRLCLRLYCWMRREDVPPKKPGNALPELQTDDIKAIIVSDTEKGTAAKLHNDPGAFMMTQGVVGSAGHVGGADNPVPVADFP